MYCLNSGLKNQMMINVLSEKEDTILTEVLKIFWDRQVWKPIKLYDAEILKKEGDYVQVKMTADYFGNKLEKIFTLYGNSPLVGSAVCYYFQKS